MTVVAMTREMGSLGKDVAAGLAERLGLKVVHHELIEHHLAERLGAPESTVHRFLEGDASLFERWKIDSKRLSRYTAEEILDLAAQGGVVIRGWGAPSLLRPIRHVLRVRVCAPMELRVERLMARLDIGDARLARREIERSDAAHASMMQHFFGTGWERPELYDLVLNTERVSVAACVEQLQQLVQRPEFQETENSKAVLQDNLVEARIRSALAKLFGAGAGRDLVDVRVGSGTAVLSGFLSDPATIKQAVGIAHGVKGVTRVESNILLFPTDRAI